MTNDHLLDTILINNAPYPLHTRPIDLLPKSHSFIICLINNTPSDLTHQITHNCTLQFLSKDNPLSKKVLYHSSAHVLGYALLMFNSNIKLVQGPPIKNGFYYDCYIDKPIKEEDLVEIQKNVDLILKNKYVFEHVMVTYEECLRLHEGNEFKKYFIDRSLAKQNDTEKVEENAADTKTNSEIKNDNLLSVYKLNTFYDFCTGPHIRSTSLIKAFNILKLSSSYFLGKSTNTSLQRVYGTSFFSKQEQKEYFKLEEQKKKMNHKLIGEQHNLIYFNGNSGGCAFFLDGTFIYNGLISFLRFEYKKRGFKEVITPNIFNTNLWEISGHLENYKDDMFIFDVEKNQYALKPMNCPAHCLIFKKEMRNRKCLPLRIADFGVLHRNELSGTLKGLTRVRRFQQDDAHIFCAFEQVEKEIIDNLFFVDFVYKKFGFKYELGLSTRPEKFLGKKEQWTLAEECLKNALDKFFAEKLKNEEKMKAEEHSHEKHSHEKKGISFESKNELYKINEGDGAFYGPKIDIILLDAFEREHQCATIQLDFQLPERFNLNYIEQEEPKRVVMIHRAIFGSLERFIGILLENFGMNLPFWLNPRQIALIPLNNHEKKINEYLNKIKNILYDYEIKVFDSDDTFNKRIRNAEMEKYVLICVIGEKEVDSNQVNVRKLRKQMDVFELKEKIDLAVRDYVKDIYEKKMVHKLKASDMRTLSHEDLLYKYKDLKTEQLKLREQQGNTTPNDLYLIKRNIAMVMTVLREKQIEENFKNLSVLKKKLPKEMKKRVTRKQRLRLSGKQLGSCRNGRSKFYRSKRLVYAYNAE